jgi:hypothetical protein
MTEAGEVAESIAAAYPGPLDELDDLDRARAYVREQMPDQTETVIDSVALALAELAAPR